MVLQLYYVIICAGEVVKANVVDAKYKEQKSLLREAAGERYYTRFVKVNACEGKLKDVLIKIGPLHGSQDFRVLGQTFQPTETLDL